MLRVGLTGGVASGKSTVAAVLAQEGYPVIDMDAIARSLTQTDSQVQSEMHSLFGTDDRAKIRQIVFQDAGKRKALEALLHPRIRAEFERQCDALAEGGHSRVIVEAALLVEGEYYKKLDELIVVVAPQAQRKQWLIQRDGIDVSLVDQMIAAQLPDDAKVRVATYVLSNKSDPAHLENQVQAMVEQWRAKDAT